METEGGEVLLNGPLHHVARCVGGAKLAPV